MARATFLVDVEPVLVGGRLLDAVRVVHEAPHPTTGETVRTGVGERVMPTPVREAYVAALTTGARALGFGVATTVRAAAAGRRVLTNGATLGSAHASAATVAPEIAAARVPAVPRDRYAATARVRPHRTEQDDEDPRDADVPPRTRRRR